MEQIVGVFCHQYLESCSCLHNVVLSKLFRQFCYHKETNKAHTLFGNVYNLFIISLSFSITPCWIWFKKKKCLNNREEMSYKWIISTTILLKKTCFLSAFYSPCYLSSWQTRVLICKNHHRLINKHKQRLDSTNWVSNLTITAT